MQGNPDVIEILNEVLTAELTAVNQYFVQSRMCRNWGYAKLAEYFYKESIGEMKDADSLIERILFFDGVPNMQRLNPVRVGETPKEQLEGALETEHEAVARLNRGIALAREAGDNGTRDLLETILHGEEEAVDWLEGQLHAIAEIGIERYLAEQLHE